MVIIKINHLYPLNVSWALQKRGKSEYEFVYKKIKKLILIKYNFKIAIYYTLYIIYRVIHLKTSFKKYD